LPFKKGDYIIKADFKLLYIIGNRKEVKMNKDIQKIKTEIFDSVKNNMEEKDVVAIIERSVNMTLKYVDTHVSTHKFFKDDKVVIPALAM
jgi:hypothetical protein